MVLIKHIYFCYQTLLRHVFFNALRHWLMSGLTELRLLLLLLLSVASELSCRQVVNRA